MSHCGYLFPDTLYCITFRELIFVSFFFSGKKLAKINSLKSFKEVSQSKIFSKIKVTKGFNTCTQTAPCIDIEDNAKLNEETSEIKTKHNIR